MPKKFLLNNSIQIPIKALLIGEDMCNTNPEVISKTRDICMAIISREADPSSNRAVFYKLVLLELARWRQEADTREISRKDLPEPIRSNYAALVELTTIRSGVSIGGGAMTETIQARVGWEIAPPRTDSIDDYNEHETIFVYGPDRLERLLGALGIHIDEASPDDIEFLTAKAPLKRLWDLHGYSAD